MKAYSKNGRSGLLRMPAILIAGIMLLGAVLAPRASWAQIFDAETFTLKNGLQVVVVPNHRAPVVFQMIAYRVGAADGPPGKNGIAHFLEHLMFKATDKLKAGQFTQEIDHRGGGDNAFTNQDMTAYHQEIAKEHLPLVMSMEANRMTKLRLTDAVVMPERDVIIEERRERIDNEPGAQLTEMMNAALFLNHPYRLPVIGWRHEMEHYSTADAVAFYHRYYAPNNAVLVIGGDVTVPEVKRLAEKYFGPIPRHDLPPRQRLQEPQQRAPRQVELTSDLVRQPYVVKTYLAPSYRLSLDNRPAQDDDAYALLLLSEILGDGTGSRLYRRLVITDKSATSADCSYDPGAYDLGTFSFYGSPVPGGDLSKVEAAINDEITLVLKDGVTEEEIALAKKRLRIATVKARDSLSGPVGMIAAALTNGRSLADVQAWPERIDAVTAIDIQRAARRVFDDRQSVTGRLLVANPVAAAKLAPQAAPPLPQSPETGAMPSGTVN